MSLYGEQPSEGNNEESETLFEHVARHNGPLEDYNPQMILQCLLWSKAIHTIIIRLISSISTDKIELVKNIIVNLAHNLEETLNIYDWKGVPVEEFFQKDETSQSVCDYLFQFVPVSIPVFSCRLVIKRSIRNSFLYRRCMRSKLVLPDWSITYSPNFEGQTKADFPAL